MLASIGGLPTLPDPSLIFNCVSTWDLKESLPRRSTTTPAPGRTVQEFQIGQSIFTAEEASLATSMAPPKS
jgi:hypothetical protein